MTIICIYCGGAATTLDHVLPWSRRHLANSRPDLRELRFLVNACNFCNCSLGSRVFPSLEARIEYIHKRHPKRIQRESQREALLINYRSYHYGDVKGRDNRRKDHKASLRGFKKRWQLRWGTIIKIGPAYYVKCHCGRIFDALEFNEVRARLKK